jgi:hypothetical protein
MFCKEYLPEEEIFLQETIGVCAPRATIKGAPTFQFLMKEITDSFYVVVWSKRRSQFDCTRERKYERRLEHEQSECF